MPLIGFLINGSADSFAREVIGFRKVSTNSGYVEGQNVTVEYHWLEGHFDGLPALLADLIHRQVAVIATIGMPAVRAAKAATATIPIVFAVPGDPIQLVLLPASLGPAATRQASIFSPPRIEPKRLRLLHDLIPKAVRVAVLLNPSNPSTVELTLREVQAARPASDCKSKASNAIRLKRSTAAFQSLKATAQTRCCRLPTGFSLVGRCNSPL